MKACFTTSSNSLLYFSIDIATQAGYVFEKSNNLELKRLLLKFVFESLTLTEGELTYKLRFPFNEFVNSNILVTQATKSHEPMQTLAEQRLQGNDNKNLQIGDIKSYELAESLIQIGEQESTKIGPKSVININFFVEHRSEILAMKEQVQMIRSFIHA